MGRERVDEETDFGARGDGTDRQQQVRGHGVHAGRPTSVRVGRRWQRGRVRLVGRCRRRRRRVPALRRRPADVLHREKHVRSTAPGHYPARSP